MSGHDLLGRVSVNRSITRTYSAQIFSEDLTLAALRDLLDDATAADMPIDSVVAFTPGDCLIQAKVEHRSYRAEDPAIDDPGSLDEAVHGDAEYDARKVHPELRP